MCPGGGDEVRQLAARLHAMTSDSCESKDPQRGPTLIIPKRSSSFISNSQFADLCAEFGTSSTANIVGTASERPPTQSGTIAILTRSVGSMPIL